MDIIPNGVFSNRGGCWQIGHMSTESADRQTGAVYSLQLLLAY